MVYTPSTMGNNLPCNQGVLSSSATALQSVYPTMYRVVKEKLLETEGCVQPVKTHCLYIGDHRLDQ